MISVSVLYPSGADTKFDMNYYLAKHIPMVKQKLGHRLQERQCGGKALPAVHRAPLRPMSPWLIWRSIRSMHFKPRLARTPQRSWAHPKLHQCETDRADQRSENVTFSNLIALPTDH